MAEEKQKPIVTLRGKDSFLSIWIQGNTVKFTVTKRSGDGFQRVDSFSMPVGYFLYEVARKNREALTDLCEFISAVEEKEE